MPKHGEAEREERIRALFPIVKRIARRIRRLVPSVDLDDLVGDGSVGLIRAVDAFDPSRGPSLEQYARAVIVGAMLNGIRRMDPVSERARRAVRDGEAIRYRIACERGCVPSVSEMEMHAPGFMRATLTAHQTQPLSLDAPLPDGEAVRSDWCLDPAAIVEARLERHGLLEALNALPPRHHELMREHYFGERSLREIGRRMRISPQRASQLHIAAIAHMKKRYDAAAH
ncbi:MAG TPA: sigma-70 family RNA polymerase sigma factor [Candidatus Baltobacteraceae bacterium]|jgi:RNA polymerase sigma factor for flagellar operon FliA|nr:sigma-70 family RNA polymerase sigma factor [Candidatus Baltobacteraceae bacterium]